MNKKLFYIEIIFLLAMLSAGNLLGQNPFYKQYFNFSSNSNNIPFGYVNKATRFLPIFSFDGFFEWSSPNLDYQIGKFNYNNFPFNYYSADLIPFDIWQGGTTDEAMRTDIVPSENRIAFYLPKSDSAKLFFNSFFGSETGDPAIHVFTKTNRRAVNRNKIPISGILGARGKINNLAYYNVSAGYFGAYSTGSINDFMLSSFDHYYFGKLNKQFLGSAEVDISTGSLSRLKLYAGIVSYYGWDIAPFIASFTHFEIINSLLRAEYHFAVKGLSLSLKRDEGIGKINQTSITKPAEFFIRTYSIKPEINFESLLLANFNGRFSLEVEYLSAGNFSLDDETAGQKFFNNQLNKFNYNTALFSKVKTKYFDLKSGIVYKYHFTKNKSFSGTLTINNFYSSRLKNFTVVISSITRDANITETFGSYSFFRNTGSSIKEFSIKGSEKIKTERTNRISVAYSLNSGWSKLNMEVFYKAVENPIKQVSNEVARLMHERDLARSAVYTNGSSKRGWGSSILFETKNFRFLNVLLNYRFLQNEDLLYSPKNKIETSAKLNLPFEVKLTFNWQYNSSSVWNDFKVIPENDFYKHNGFDGKVGEVSSFNLYFEYGFTRFYFFERLNVKMSFINIFNKEVRFHPLGNRMDRAFIFSLSGEL